MLRASILVFLLAPFASAAREDDEVKAGNVQISLNTKSFAKVHGEDKTAEQPEDEDAVQRARPEDEEDSEVAAKAESRSKLNFALGRARHELQEAISEAEHGEAKAKEALHAAGLDKAKGDESQQQQETSNFAQKAYEMAKESDTAAALANEMAKEEDKASAKAAARVKFAALAKQRNALVNHADDLEKAMHEQYSAMLGSEVGASLLSVSEDEDDDDKETEDAQFQALEAQTGQIMAWFSDLKALRMERDEMLVHKKAAMSHGLALGLEPDFLNSELQHDAFGTYPMKFPKAQDAETEAKGENLDKLDKAAKVEKVKPEDETSWIKEVVKDANNDEQFQLDRQQTHQAKVTQAAADALDQALPKQTELFEQDLLKTASEARVTASEAEMNQVPEVKPQEHKVDPFDNDHRKKLAAVMASSAIEMAQIKSASDDVLAALDDLTEWKKGDDQSPESDRHALKVQARLHKAMAFLQEHEETINIRTKQIHSMMRDAGMSESQSQMGPGSAPHI